MSKLNLFDCCNKTPTCLIKHFQDTFIIEQTHEIHSHSIGIHTYYKYGIIEDITTIFRLIRSKWYCVQDVVLNNNTVSITDVVSSRKFINEGFVALTRSSLNENALEKEKSHEIILKLLKTFTSSIVPIGKLDVHVLLKIKLAKQETCPYYQYLHTLLEVHYFVLVLYFICGSKTENIENHLQNIMKNVFLFSKVNGKEFLKPDTCTCIDFFWLVIQLITEKSDVTNNLFWRIFNKVMDKEDPLISLSILKEMSMIQRFNSDFKDVGARSERIKPNYHFLEVKFKELLSQASSDCNSLIISFRLIEPLICDLWLKEGKIDILQIIWEFYSKRLNVSNKNSCNISALGFIETLDTVLFCPKDCAEDFEFFIGLLLHHLREYPMHWGKMKGRIYSQLGPNKVKDLTDIGIRHVMILFLALSSIHFEEVEKKILTFLDNLPKDKKYSSFLWNMYAALVVKYVREGHSIEKIAPSIARMLEEASTNQKQLCLIKDFMKNLEPIINQSASMQLHQWLLFGPWLGRYQSICYFTDLNYSLNIIGLLLEKCSNADSWSFWERFFKEYVYLNLKQLATTSNPPAIIGKIAGKLALSYNNLSNEAFSFFTSDLISPKIASTFLEVILHSYPDSLILTPQQENMILQSWVKICFLTLEPQCELTRNVVKLDVFPHTLKSNLKVVNEPMESFIQYIGENSKQLTVQTNNEMLKLCDLAFNNLDKILSQYLLNPDNEQIVIKIYKYVSLMFLNCGTLIYNRNKPVTILTKCVQALLLPMHFLVGKKTLHNFILNAVKKFWSTFFDALINLNSSKDAYLERTLKDMVVKYLPYFPTSDSPIVYCLENSKMAEIILEKICHAYFKPPVKESDASLLKALKIVSDLANSTTSIPLFKLLISKTLFGLFEVVIFHPQRSSAIGVIKHITNSCNFFEVKAEFKQSVLAVTEKYMALNTINYFQLIICLAKFVPEDIKDMLEDIRVNVDNVEKLRGVGFDKTLRLHLERLENALQSC